MIYHLIKRDKWNLLKSCTSYAPNSLNREGYIHCSYRQQIIKVADTLYKGQQDLMVLCIDENKVKDICKSEDLFNLNEKYPHIYGELPLDAVRNIVELNVDNDGSFISPDFSALSSLFVKQQEWT